MLVYLCISFCVYVFECLPYEPVLRAPTTYLHPHPIAAAAATMSLSTATFVGFSLVLALLYLDAILLLFIGGGAQLMIQHLSRYGQKHILHIEVVFGGCLEQLNIHLPRKALRILCYDHFAIRIIILIAHWKSN